MELRRYKEKDTEQLCDIYFNTIHKINKIDYTEKELEAWAPSDGYTKESYEKDRIRWNKIKPFVVVEGDIALGFAELEEKGHINCFFVHHDYQGRGVGTMLLAACLNEAKQLGYKKVFAEVSITSKPFFINKGFTIKKPILCDIKGMKIKYYHVEKELK